MNVLLLSSLIVYLLAGLLTLPGGGKQHTKGLIGSLGSVVAALLGIIPVIHVLSGGAPVDIRFAWNLPLGSFHLRLDVLSAWFAVPVLLVSALAAVYGAGYMRPHASRGGIGLNWLGFQLLAGGMLLVLVAWDGILFLIAWEIMSIAAWLLVMFEHEHESVQRAGWIYLAATHLGTAFLFAMFVLLGSDTGSFDFSSISAASISANIIFLLAVLGFGAKAGFFGLHVWLPEAHPAAPSHVSGVMSGVMIKTGIYGLLRLMSLSTPWSDWWGWLLIIIGVLSGLGGVLYALAQHDIKRLLAYHSVENIGIICLGLGLGVLGINYHHPLAVLGIAGALLHVLNHAVFKTALFMGAGAVVHASGTRNIDQLGGLQKRMPVTAAAFLVSAAAICGLPPLNGFVSEFLIYMASYQSITQGVMNSMSMPLGGFAVIAALALIGGLAAMCFAKVFSIVFLGEARQKDCLHAHETPPSMRAPMVMLAGLCLVLGLGGFFLVRLIAPVAACIHPYGASAAALEPLSQAALLLRQVALIAAGLAALCLLLVLLRRHLLKKRTITQAPTWGCGYTCPTPRMQYTGSSFVQPLLSAFDPLFRTRRGGNLPEGYLPRTADFASHTHDPCMQWLYEPLFAALAALFNRLHRIQNGRLHCYLLYLILTLAGIIVWSLL